MTSRDQSTPTPPVLPGSVVRKASWPIWIILGGLAAALVLWLFEPHGQFFYPRCWLYSNTGLQCPGCGGLRAAHALLHGELREAWRLNPLAVVLTPFGAWWVVVELLNRVRHVPLRHPFHHPKFWIVFGVISVVFGIARNWR